MLARHFPDVPRELVTLITTRGYGMDLFHVAVVVVNFLPSVRVNLPANQRQLMPNVGVF